MYNSGRPHAEVYMYSQVRNITRLHCFGVMTYYPWTKRDIYDRMLEMKDVLVRYQALPECRMREDLISI